MDQIRGYLEHRNLPANNDKAQALVSNAQHYQLDQGILYKKLTWGLSCNVLANRKRCIIPWKFIWEYVGSTWVLDQW